MFDVEKRQAEPGEDDFPCERIEVEFYLPAYVTIDQQRRLSELLDEITRAPVNQPVGGVHWVAGMGSKPSFSQADQRFLGGAVDPDAPLTGEPTFDDTVLHFETFARERYPKEGERAMQEVHYSSNIIRDFYLEHPDQKAAEEKMEARLKDLRAEHGEPASVVRKFGIGRNHACPCGSGKKFKRCCMPR